MIDPVTASIGAAAVGNVVGGVLGSSGAKKQAKVMRDALNYQKQKDAETQARFVPFQELGKESVNEFQKWRDDPTKDPMAYLDPSYDFMRDQGMKAVTGNAATAGTLQSGDTLRALEQFGQDYANTGYNNAFNRWLQEGQFKGNMAGMGQNAAGQQGALAMQGAGNVGNISANMDAGASDYIWGDVAAGTGGMVGNALARRFSPTPSTTPGGSNIFAMSTPSRLQTGAPQLQVDPRYMNMKFS